MLQVKNKYHRITYRKSNWNNLGAAFPFHIEKKMFLLLSKRKNHQMIVMHVCANAHVHLHAHTACRPIQQWYIQCCANHYKFCSVKDIPLTGRNVRSQEFSSQKLFAFWKALSKMGTIIFCLKIVVL